MKTFTWDNSKLSGVKRCINHSVFFLIIALLGNAYAESLEDYVAMCQTELEFVGAPVPTMSCYDGEAFAPQRSGEVTNDYFGYAKITDQVDLTLACRWVNGDKQNPLRGGSVEMMLHNRDNGKTCYFSGIEVNPGSNKFRVPPLVLSINASDYSELTQADLIANGFSSTTAIETLSPSDYWRQPEEVATSSFQCATCHIKGPYIASRRIAPYLAKHGIMNNGHDNFRSGIETNGYAAALGPDSAFTHFNDIIYGSINISPSGNIIENDEINVDDTSCASGCHDLVNENFPRFIEDVTFLGTLLPSIHTVVDETAFTFFEMRPSDKDSEYRWFNTDIPSDSIESEKFETVIGDDRFKNIVYNCSSPGLLEARAIGSDLIFTSADQFPDQLEYFNVREGLRCNDNQHGNGPCSDYEVRYFCPTGIGTQGEWTHTYDEAWYNVDQPGPSADAESRQNLNNALSQMGQQLCDGKEPTGIQARTHANGGVYSHVGPNDRLASLNSTGLECHNNQQPGGESCSNYAVRFKHCAQDDYLPVSDFYEITVTVVPNSINVGEGEEGDYRVYVDDIALTLWDIPTQTPIGENNDTERNYYQRVFRTNATGELTIVTNGFVDIVKVTINDIRKPQLDRRPEVDDKIVLRARGTSGSEVIRVTVAGQEIARFNLSTSWNEYSTNTNVFGGVNVEFLNDANNRDVVLDWVRINGETRQTENQTYNTATYANGSCGGGTGDWMHCGTNSGSGRGVIGFGNVTDTNTGGIEYSYGHISHLPMPSVVTIVDEYEDPSYDFCARVINQNTSNSTQSMRFNFEVTRGNIASTWNIRNVVNGSSGVITGYPSFGSPQTLAPYQRSDLIGAFSYCADY